MNNKKLPVYIISGFLGSGKTTVLLKALKELKSQGKQVAVVLNELGEINVEKDLFADEKVVEMLNGCICCTIQSDLSEELSLFIQQENSIDVILIEGTGIANPTEIMEVLTHPSLIDKVEIQSIITLIDASRFLEYQSIFSSSKEIRKVLKEQLESCSLLLLNKVDLVNEKQLNKVSTKIMDQIKENVEILETTFGEVSIDTLLEPRMSTLHLNIKKSCSCSHSGCEHEEHHHNHGFSTIKINQFAKIDRISFEKWLKQLPENIIRAKGIVQFNETPRKFQFQFASKQLQLENLNDQQMEPCLIIIGYDTDVEAIRRSFTNSVIEVK